MNVCTKSVYVLMLAVCWVGYSHTPPASYSIRGASKNLSSKKRRAMRRWRVQVQKLAQEHPTTIFLNGPSDQKMVSLTFDDGPDAVVTPRILDVLARYQVKATFFFVGEKIAAQSDVVQRAYREGHVIASHAWHHDDLAKKTDADVHDELLQTQMALYTQIGKKTVFMRPPYGSLNRRVLQEIEQMGYRVILWSLDTLDWAAHEKNSIVRTIMRNVRAGDIILMHCDESRQATLDALPEIIQQLRRRKFSLVDVATLLNRSAYR
jgi:peptidoglycan/xylan/chitin deacetylase (PgdA/CDA1 family)